MVYNTLHVKHSMSWVLTTVLGLGSGSAGLGGLGTALGTARPRACPGGNAAPLPYDFFTDFSVMRQRFQIHPRYFLHLSCYRISDVHDFYTH